MSTTVYTWNPLTDSVIEESDGSGNSLRTYTNEPSQFGPLISENRGGTTSYYLADAIGSTRLTTNSSQTVVDSFLFDAWGNTVVSNEPTTTPYQWCGRWGYQTDSDLDSSYVRARTYLPGTGHWLSVDPMSARWRTLERNAFHLYTYVANSPIRNLDPSGLIEGNPLLTANPDWIFGGAGGGRNLFPPPIFKQLNLPPVRLGPLFQMGDPDIMLRNVGRVPNPPPVFNALTLFPISLAPLSLPANISIGLPFVLPTLGFVQVPRSLNLDLDIRTSQNRLYNFIPIPENVTTPPQMPQLGPVKLGESDPKGNIPLEITLPNGLKVSSLEFEFLISIDIDPFTISSKMLQVELTRLRE